MYATTLTKTDLNVLLIDKFPGVGLYIMFSVVHPH